MADLLAADAENDHDAHEKNDDIHPSWIDRDYSLHFDEGWECQNDAADAHMAISSDDDAIFENFPSVQNLTKSKQRPKKKARTIQGKRNVAQDINLSESDSGTDPETCGKWVTIYLWQ